MSFHTIITIKTIALIDGIIAVVSDSAHFQARTRHTFIEDTIYYFNVILSFIVLFEYQNCIVDELQCLIVEFVLFLFKHAHIVKVDCLSFYIIVLLLNFIN